VDGQGNFGSVDGDAPAAMRYTEVRMSKFAHALLADLDKETVDFAPNYDETEFAPIVLPTRVPNLLVNGSSGIAVGMATNIPPHNITEVINGCLALIENADITIEGLMEFIKGPDFPTAASIHGRAGILEAYRTGRGRVYVRAKSEVEVDNSGKQTIVITEIPYQVNKARLIEKIAELVKEKKVEGISALRDESDKDGMRIVIELKRNEIAEVILNNLYAHTQLQSVFGINMVALINGQPRTMNLKEILEAFVRHRRVVVNRRTAYDLRKAQERAHLLEGWTVALANIDEVIEAIKTSESPAQAKERLVGKVWQSGMVASLLEKAGVTATRPQDLEEFYGQHTNGYQLSNQQAQAILDLKLHRLTGLEQTKITDEYEAIIGEIKELSAILHDPVKLMDVIKSELVEVKETFGDERRTLILADKKDISEADLITEEARVVTLSQEGYVKTQPLDTYSAQKRGGRGKMATSVKDEDYIKTLLIANTHDTILCFSNHGKVYWLKVYELPLGSRTSRGKPIINCLPLEAGETISAILPLRDFDTGAYVCLATKAGTIKKVALSEFSRPRSNGIIAIDLVEGDSLIGAELTHEKCDIMLISNAGKAVRFHEDDVRGMGRTARGVRGIKLQENQEVIALIVVDPESELLIATENGYGKRTKLGEFPTKGRGGQGVIAIQTSERNGQVVGAIQLKEMDEVMIITDGGTLVRTKAEGISLVGRNTQGVRLINLSNGEKCVGIQRVEEEDEEESL
ncbi:MAG TPA: DNA gyrase subunit A, partial [Gammaproteobacteria bacterium]|nr:DNA gyrase subunit A [Gammaproteobacteria bacterium]